MCGKEISGMGYPRHKILLVAALMEGGALVIALLLAEYFDIQFFPLSLNPVHDILIGTAGAVVPFILFMFTISEKARNLPVLGPLRETVLVQVREFFINTKLVDLVLISLVAGFAEEMLFRGVLQAKYGIIAASAVFGLLHCVSSAYFIAAAIMGFYIGIFFIVSGNLLVPIQMHFIYDLAALVYIRYFVKEKL